MIHHHSVIFCPLGSLGWSDFAPLSSLKFRRTLQSWMLHNQWCKTTPRHTVSQSEIATDSRPGRAMMISICCMKLCVIFCVNVMVLHEALQVRALRQAEASSAVQSGAQATACLVLVWVVEMYGNVTRCDKAKS